MNLSNFHNYLPNFLKNLPLCFQKNILPLALGYLSSFLLLTVIYLLPPSHRYCNETTCTLLLTQFQTKYLDLISTRLIGIVIGLVIVSYFFKATLAKIAPKTFFFGLGLSLGTFIARPFLQKPLMVEYLNEGTRPFTEASFTSEFIVALFIIWLIPAFWHLVLKQQDKEAKSKSDYSAFLESDKPIQSMHDIELVQEYANDFERKLFRSTTSVAKAILVKIYTKSSDGHSIAICIDGRWGSGKTSLVNIIDNDIRERKTGTKICIKDFSPWNFNSPTELIRDFFTTLSNTLADDFHIDIKSDLFKYTELLTPVVEKNIYLNLLFKILKSQRTLAEQRVDIKNKLQSIKGKIVIIIDDLDRMDVENILLILKLIKESADFPNIIFILPFDYERVDNLIQQKRRFTSGSYLQKIINHRYRLELPTNDEREAILMAVLRNKFEKEMESDDQRVKDIFDFYLLEAAKHFVRIWISEHDSVRTKNQILTPGYHHVEIIFKKFYPNRHLEVELFNNLFSTFIAPVFQDLIIGKFSSFNELATKELFNAMERVARGELRNTVRSRVDGYSSFIEDVGKENLRGELSQLNRTHQIRNWDRPGGIYGDFVSDVFDDQKIRADKLEEVVSSHLNVIKKYIKGDRKNELEKEIDTLISQVKEHNQKYLGPGQPATLKLAVKNWLQEEITLRDVKQFARKIADEAKSADWLNDRKNWEELTKQIAHQQFGN